jgi:hypothetical protein
MVQRTGTGVDARGHVVLASADSDAFTSLRRRSTSRLDRYRMGRELRRQVPRRSLGDWSAPTGRPDPVQLIIESHKGRLDWLIPVRVGRMAATPYGFLRGAAIVMAADVARLPSTGITPVICGDAHLGNFGFYASPERDLVIDLNDFDEAHPGGWEWDLRRLVASIWVAGRQNGAGEPQCEAAVRQCVAGYRDEVRALASTPLLARSYQRLDADRLQQRAIEKSLRAEIKRAAAQARRRTSDRALPKFTSERDGQRRIVEDPPLVTRINYAEAEQIARGLDEYLGTLAPHWRRALGGYTLIDIAHKVVGVAASGCAPTSRCSRAAAPTTCCSSSSSRPAGRFSPATCTVIPPGTPTRASAWWSTSRPCRRSAIRCWAGPQSVGGSITSASSGT